MSMTMARRKPWEVSDELWAVIEPLFRSMSVWFRRLELTTLVDGFRQHLAITRIGNVDEK
ncbi:hypothetical protein [Streptomyces europaeiscabiei]|uniref:hypothetical protein n=1 Tax=Streptomyces europaeiscabiei TaxID=146819 RepID=UPI0038D37A7D